LSISGVNLRSRQSIFDPDAFAALSLKTSRHLEEVTLQRLEEWCFDEADDYLAIHELEVDDGSRLRLAKAIAASVQRASLKLVQWAKSEFDDPPAPKPSVD
jgi:hypothetical protein